MADEVNSENAVGLSEDSLYAVAGLPAQFLNIGIIGQGAMGIVHRDLKPSNIMICSTDDDKSVVKIIDFGIARLEQASGKSAATLTNTNATIGSPTYMSPEQCRGGTINQHSDIYSLGCVMYE